MSTEQIKIQYKGFTIRLNGDDAWQLLRGEDNYIGEPKESLRIVKENADDIIRKEKSFKPIPCLVSPGWGRELPVPAVVTTLTDDGDVWIKKADGRREKVRSRSQLFAVCDENTETIKKYKQAEVEAQKISELKDEILGELLPLKHPALTQITKDTK
jgi:hypothetical protein